MLSNPFLPLQHLHDTATTTIPPAAATAAIPLFFLRSRHAAIHSMAFQLPTGEYIKDVDPRFAEPLRFNTMPPPPPRTTGPRATTTPRRNILSLLQPPSTTVPSLPCRSRGPMLWRWAALSAKDREILNIHSFITGSTGCILQGVMYSVYFVL